MSDTIERALEKQRKLQEAKDRENSQTVEPTAAAAPQPESAETPAASPSASAPPQPTPEAVAVQKTVSNDDSYVHIDIRHLEEAGMVAPTENFSKIKEEYRYIKRPILNAAFGENGKLSKLSNLVLVSSCFSGEGKTFTAINLAMSMVLEQDRNVLLVDADVIRPSLCSRLKLEDRPRLGLLDYLTGNASVNEIILNTNIPRLKIITAGTKHHHSNEMLASDKMQQFMNELATRYGDRVVVFDSAPVLGASETSVLAQMTGQTVLVVEEEKTTRGQVNRALSVLPETTAVGLVLNKAKSSRREYYGYYYASE